MQLTVTSRVNYNNSKTFIGQQKRPDLLFSLAEVLLVENPENAALRVAAAAEGHVHVLGWRLRRRQRRRSIKSWRPSLVWFRICHQRIASSRARHSRRRRLHRRLRWRVEWRVDRRNWLQRWQELRRSGLFGRQGLEHQSQRSLKVYFRVSGVRSFGRSNVGGSLQGRERILLGRVVGHPSRQRIDRRLTLIRQSSGSWMLFLLGLLQWQQPWLAWNQKKCKLGYPKDHPSF